MTERRWPVGAWAGRALIGYGGIVLAVWIAHPGLFAVLIPGSNASSPVVAVSLLLLGLALVGSDRSSARWTSVAMALVAVVAVIRVGSRMTGHSSLFAGSLFRGSWGETVSASHGSMALGTAVALLAASVGIAVARRSLRVASACALITFAIAYVALLGHLYGASDLYRLQSATSMAPASGIALLVASIGVAWYLPGMPLERALRADGTAGLLVRRMLPGALVVPPAVGYLHLLGHQHGLFGDAYGVALLVLAYAATTVLAVFLGARSAARLDAQRRGASAQLEALNVELGERVEAATAEARAGRERLSLLLDSTPVGIFETGADGVRRYVNQRWRDITGITGEGSGDDWTDVIHPDDLARVRAELAENMAAGTEYTTRYRYLAPNGAVTWCDATTRALRGAAGELTGWLGSVTDVSRQVEAVARLEESERRYRSVVSALVEGVMVQDREGRMTSVNAAACAIFGTPRDALIGRRPDEALGMPVHEDGTTFTADELPSRKAMHDGAPVRDVTMGLTRPDGSLVWLRVNGVPLGVDEEDGCVTTFVDATEQLRAQSALRRSEQQFRLSMSHAPIGMALVSLDGHLLEVNQALARLTGYDEDELVGKTFQQITHPDDLDSDLEQFHRLLDGTIDHYTIEKRYIQRGGDAVWVLLSASLVDGEDGAPAYAVAQVQDITAARAAQEELAHRALHDPLTGLANRELLHEHLRRALARAVRRGQEVAVLFCDLDRFKDVNDTYGHEAGDTVLRVVAERIERSLRPADAVGRLGGDEFVVVVEDISHPELVEQLAARIHIELLEPIDLGGGVSVVVGTSIGVAKGAGRDVAGLLREADGEMYRAKRSARGRLAAAPVVAPSL